MKYYSCIILYLLFGTVAVAQPVKQYSFTHFGTRNGLLSNHVEDIEQDDKGYMWVATMSGLQRFDGHWFVNFLHNPADPASIPDNEIWDLHIDKKKNLWLLFGSGKTGIFNTSTFRFTEVKVGISTPAILKADKLLYEDSKGNVMIYFAGLGVLTYSELTHSFETRHNPFEIPKGTRLYAVSEKDGMYWLGLDSGIALYNSRNHHLSWRGQNTDHLQFIERYKGISHVALPYEDNRHRLWFLTWPPNVGGAVMYCYDLKKEAAFLDDINIPAAWGRYGEPRKFTEQKDGRLILTGTPMLMEFDEQRKAFLRINNMMGASLTNEFDNVPDAYSDREGNIWVCTANDGMYRFNPSQQLFISVPHLNAWTKKPGSGGMLSFIRLRDGSILASAWGDGTARYDSALNPLPQGIKGIDESYLISAWNFCRRKDSSIWIGMQKEGGNIMVYDERKQTIKQHKVFERITVRQLAEDHTGNMWVGTQSKGVFKWDAVKGAVKFEEAFSKIAGIPDIMITKLYTDSAGFIWANTLGDGVYRINPVTDKIMLHLAEKTSPRLLEDNTGPLLQYNDSLMLIAAGGLNIYNIKSNSMRTITTANGLPTRFITSMLKDDEGFVWVGLLNGICRLDIFNGNLSYFDREDGMVNDDFGEDAAMKLPDGRLLFGTNRDILVFNPHNVNLPGVPPDVTITEFKVANTSLRMDSLLQQEAVELSFDNNAVVIDFASLTNLQNSSLTYYYMLEGLDKDWIKADKIQRAAYPYLEPGEYLFKVKVMNAAGVFCNNVSSIKLIVKAPFWRQGWFYGMLLLLAGLVLYLVDRERMRRKELVQQMRSNIAGRLHQDVNTALSNINVLSEMARLKADQEPGKSKEFIEQIHSRSGQMMQHMEDMLWALSPDNDSMQQTVLRLQECVEELNRKYDADMQLLADEKLAAVKPDMQQRYELFMLLQESLHQLVKAGARHCSVHLGIEKNTVSFSVQFNNSSFDMQQLVNFTQAPGPQQRLENLNGSWKTEMYSSNGLFVIKLLM